MNISREAVMRILNETRYAVGKLPGPHGVQAFEMLSKAVDEIYALPEAPGTDSALRETCEQHRQYAHMMQEQRSQLAEYLPDPGKTN